MMQNLNYQIYLNSIIDYDAFLWRDYRKRCQVVRLEAAEASPGQMVFDYRHLDWDTEVLGVASARIDNVFFCGPGGRRGFSKSLAKVERALAGGGAELACIRFDLNQFDIWQALERGGWKTTDVMNIYCAKLPVRVVKIAAGGSIGLSFSDVTFKQAADFFGRAKDIFVHSRMYKDQQIPVEKARQFYKRLFDALCSKPTTIKLGLFKGKRLVGIALGEIDGPLRSATRLRLGYLWEIAIAPDSRGKGYSKLLFRRFAEIMSGRVDYLEVGTQVNNIAANRLYASCGLYLKANAVTLHKWLK